MSEEQLVCRIAEIIRTKGGPIVRARRIVQVVEEFYAERREEMFRKEKK